MSTRKRKRMRGGGPRIAVLFSGRIKAYEFVKEKLKALQDKYSATFFCSLNKKTLSPYIQKFCDTYDMKPDQLHLEQTIAPDWLDSMEIHPHPGITRIGTYSVLYHIKKAFDLIEAYQQKNKTRFDIILYYRADIDPQETIQLSPPEKATVYVPNWGGLYNAEDWDRKYGIHASVTYGDYDSMKKYCATVDNIKDLCDTYNVAVSHEGLVTMQLIVSRINIERINHSFGMLPQRQQTNKEYDDFD